MEGWAEFLREMKNYYQVRTKSRGREQGPRRERKQLGVQGRNSREKVGEAQHFAILHKCQRQLALSP